MGWSTMRFKVQEPRWRSKEEELVLWTLALLVSCAVAARAVFLVVQRVVKSSSGRCQRDGDAGVATSTQRKEADAVGEDVLLQVEKRVTEIKAAQMRTYMQLLGIASLPLTVQVLLGLGLGERSGLVTPAQEIILLLQQALCLVPILRPASVTAARLDACFVVLTAPLCLMTQPLACCSREGAAGSFMMVTLGMAALNLVRGMWRTRREFLLTSLCNAAFVLSWARGFFEVWGTTLSFLNLLAGVLVQAGILLLATFLAYFLEDSFRCTLQQSLQLAEVKEVHNAACALLRSCYDIVVELGSGGRLEGGSQDLASFLLRANREGVCLADFIVDETERQNFVNRLADPRMTMIGLAESMHVSMKDGAGNTIRVEMMWFDFKRIDGQKNFMVGIREFADFSSPAGRTTATSQAQTPVPPVLPPEDSETEEASPLKEGPQQSTLVELPLPAETSVELLDTVEEERALMIIDVISEECLIRGVSRSFRVHIGHVPRDSPLKRITKRPREMGRSELTEVATTDKIRAQLEENAGRWLATAVNCLASDQDAEDFGVTLLMPQGKLRAQCSVLLPESLSAEADTTPSLDLENVVVQVHSIHSRVHKTSSRRGSSGSREFLGTPACSASNEGVIPGGRLMSI